MPRKGFVKKREAIPDTRYNDIVITRVINSIMKEGKKSVAESIVYGALELVSKKSNNANAMVIFKQALDNVKPMLEVKARRVGGQNYQVPVEVSPVRRSSLAVRWIIESARARAEKVMKEKLANEILDAAKNTGAAVKKREDMHKMAEANKAFVHFKW
ncbi:MAG: 30S ribosomal protein S7 [Candidatus Firestonebacteria bacterium]